MKVVNPETKRDVTVSASPSSVFSKIWQKHEVRRQLTMIYGRTLMRELARLGIVSAPTPLRFIQLPSGAYGVDNDFLHRSASEVRMQHTDVAPSGRQATRNIDRVALRDSDRACFLDPTRLAYRICSSDGRLDCRSLEDASAKGRRLGTPTSRAISETALALRDKFCDRPV